MADNQKKDPEEQCPICGRFTFIYNFRQIFAPGYTYKICPSCAEKKPVPTPPGVKDFLADLGR